MKTNSLTLLIFAVASFLYSCSKESDENCSSNSLSETNAPLTTAERRLIISNCGGHAGCHSSARLATDFTMQDVNISLKNNIDANHSLSICNRTKLQSWFNGELKQ